MPSVVTNNPFRYRGYYYDIDLGLYYLNARYYDAGIGRFISPDSLGYLGANGDLNSYNLFAYCSNNPVMYADPSGHSIIAAIIIGAIIGASIGFGATVYKDYEDDGEVFNGSVDAIDYVANTVVGGIVGSATGALASSIAPAIGSFLSTSFSFSSPFALAGGEAIAITVTGAQLVGAGASAVAIGVALFASNNRPKDNRKQNEQFRSAMRELNITDKDKMRRVHDQIKGKNMGYRQLIDFIKEILNIP